MVPLDTVRGNVLDKQIGECVSCNFWAGLELALVGVQHNAVGVDDTHRLRAISQGRLEAVPQAAFTHRRQPGLLV